MSSEALRRGGKDTVKESKQWMLAARMNENWAVSIALFARSCMIGLVSLPNTTSVLRMCRHRR